MLVQALVAEPAIEGFNKAVLHGLARGNVVPLDEAVFLPLEDGVLMVVSRIGVSRFDVMGH